MADYDNKNKGAVFAPKEEQIMILSGSITDANDNKERVIVVKDRDHQGNDILAIYERVGLMYRNEDAEGSQPAYSGPYKQGLRLAGWKNSSDTAGDYMSLKISEKGEQKKETAANDSVF